MPSLQNIGGRFARDQLAALIRQGTGTMPGFPDKFSPFYVAPPGSMLSSTTSRLVGSFIRRLRVATMTDKNRSTRWTEGAPSGWAMQKSPPNTTLKLMAKFYNA